MVNEVTSFMSRSSVGLLVKDLLERGHELAVWTIMPLCLRKSYIIPKL